MRSDDFAGGEAFTPERPTEGDCWSLPEIGWPELRIHPLHLLDEEDMTLLHLWRASQGGMAGPGPLPEAGGLIDQPACVMACFDVMTAAEAAFKKAVRREHGCERRVFIRVSTRDADRAVAELRRIGVRGERSLKRITRASRPASAGLVALDRSAGLLNRQLAMMAGRVAPLQRPPPSGPSSSARSAPRI